MSQMTVSWENNKLKILGCYKQEVKLPMYFGNSEATPFSNDDMKRRDLLHPWAMFLYLSICPALPKYSIISSPLELLTWTLQKDNTAVELRFNLDKENAMAFYARNLIQLVLLEYYPNFIFTAREDAERKLEEHLESKTLIFEYESKFNIDFIEFWNQVHDTIQILGHKQIINAKKAPEWMYNVARKYDNFDNFNVMQLLMFWKQ